MYFNIVGLWFLKVLVVQSLAVEVFVVDLERLDMNKNRFRAISRVLYYVNELYADHEATGVKVFGKSLGGESFFLHLYYFIL